MKNPIRQTALTVAFGLLALVSYGADTPSYHFLKEIPIGGDGGWDYLSVDPAGRRLYVSHGTKVVVVDIDAYSIAGEIPDTPGVHGFAIAPEFPGNGIV